MTSLVSLESALSLLSASYSPQNGTKGQTASIAQPSKAPTPPPISGAASANISITTALSIANGVVTGTYNQSGGTPASTNTIEYQGFQAFMSENSMTNQHLTAAVYSGTGLSTGGGSQTFLNAVNEYYGGSQTAAEIVSALNNHTLQVQNAANVQGLDYSRESVASTGNNGAGSISGNVSFNTAFLNNNPNHALIGLGEAQLYLTW